MIEPVQALQQEFYHIGNGGFHDGFKLYQTAIPAARTDVRLYKLRATLNVGRTPGFP